MRKKILFVFLACALAALACGCGEKLQRGMLEQTYVSTARPAIAISVPNMPLMAAGRGSCNMFWTGMLGGLPIDLWIAVYGQGGLAPMAIVTQAQVPQEWYWDSIMRQPFCVDEGTEAFNGVTYQACTVLVNPATDPFGGMVTGTRPDGQPQLWMARYYAARYNFNKDKIILEYREPLPAGVESLTSLPLGQGMLLSEFAARAREVFKVAAPPRNPRNVADNFIQGVQFKYMNQQFLGTVSQATPFSVD